MHHGGREKESALLSEAWAAALALYTRAQASRGGLIAGERGKTGKFLYSPHSSTWACKHQLYVSAPRIPSWSKNGNRPDLRIEDISDLVESEVVCFPCRVYKIQTLSGPSRRLKLENVGDDEAWEEVVRLPREHVPVEGHPLLRWSLAWQGFWDIWEFQMLMKICRNSRLLLCEIVICN